MAIVFLLLSNVLVAYNMGNGHVLPSTCVADSVSGRIRIILLNSSLDSSPPPTFL